MEHYKHAKHLDFYVTAVITNFVLEILSYNYWSPLVLYYLLFLTLRDRVTYAYC